MWPAVETHILLNSPVLVPNGTPPNPVLVPRDGEEAAPKSMIYDLALCPQLAVVGWCCEVSTITGNDVGHAPLLVSATISIATVPPLEPSPQESK